MYAMAAKWTFTRDLTDQEVNQLLDTVEPLIESQAGFQHYYAIQLDGRTALVVHFWDSKEHAEQAREQTRPRALAAAPSGLLQSLEAMNGEVQREFSP